MSPLNRVHTPSNSPFKEKKLFVYLVPVSRNNKLYIESHKFSLLNMYLAPQLGVTPLKFYQDLRHQTTSVHRLLWSIVCVMLWHCSLGGRKDIRPVKKWGEWWRWALVSPDGAEPSRMVCVSASVNLPLHHKVQKFFSGTDSPGWSRKKGRKTAVCVCVMLCFSGSVRLWLETDIHRQSYNIYYTSIASCRKTHTSILHVICWEAGVWLPALNNFCHSFLSSSVLLSATYFPFIRSLSRCILFTTSCSLPPHSSLDYIMQYSCLSTCHNHICVFPLCLIPFPQIDIIGAMVIVWRVRGKIIRSVLCNIICNNCAQCNAHTYNRPNSSLDWVLSHWAHFTVLRFIFVSVLLCVHCMHVYCVVL